MDGLLTAIALCLSPAASPLEPIGLDTPLVPEIVVRNVPSYEPPRVTLRERMRESGVPGLSIAVVIDGKVAWARGFGVRDAGTLEPVTERTLFQAASISKPVAAFGAARMAQDGRIDLDASVADYLTSWALPEQEGASAVTLRGLLTHTAGINVHGFPGYASGEAIPTPVGVLDGLGNTPAVTVATASGSEHRYSGGGYTIAQVAMVDASGGDGGFPALLSELVLAPLGMSDSTFEQPLPEAWWGRAASAHDEEGAPYPGRWHTYPEMAAAGLWTTPTDLARFFVSLQAGFEGRDGPVLTAESARGMLEAPLDVRYGLGLSLGADRFGHGGGNAGFRCAATFYYEGGNGAVVMSNGDNGWPVNSDVMRTVFHHYGWEGLGPFERVVLRQTRDELSRFAGVYEIDGYGRLSVSVDNAALGLEVALPDGSTFALLPESETTFFDPADGVPISFVLGADGVAERAEWSGSVATRVGG